jgi:hypothetical protein
MIAFFVLSVFAQRKVGFNPAKALSPEDPETVDEWKNYSEQGPEGDCPAKVSDATLDAMVDACKADEDLCEKTTGNSCKGAWKANKKYAAAACAKDACNRACKKKHFSWCGLSAGAIAGIVIACVVVVGVIVGVVVYFVVIKPKKEQVAGK